MTFLALISAAPALGYFTGKYIYKKAKTLLVRVRS